MGFYTDSSKTWHFLKIQVSLGLKEKKKKNQPLYNYQIATPHSQRIILSQRVLINLIKSLWKEIPVFEIDIQMVFTVSPSGEEMWFNKTFKILIFVFRIFTHSDLHSLKYHIWYLRL